MAATNSGAGGLTSFEILINGKAVDHSVLVARIDVLASYSDPGRAMIVVEQEQGGEFPVAPGEAFPMGAKLSIALGYDGQTTPVFSGTIDTLGARSSQTQQARLQVEALEDFEQRSAPGDQPDLVLTYGDTILTMDLTRSGSSGLGGEVQTQGTTTVGPGDLVTLAGLGRTFNGDSRVSALQHRVEAGLWTTTLQLGWSDASADPS